MKRYASVRFGGALSPEARQAAERSLNSAGVTPTLWASAAGRVYAAVEFQADGADNGEQLRARPWVHEFCDTFPGTRVDTPPLAVLRVRPERRMMLPRLRAALDGAGRPAGILEVRPEPARSALVVDLDTRRTRLALVVALIDVELAACPGRVIEPLLPFDDGTLAEFVGDALGIAELEPSRIIETHLDAVLGERAC